MKTTSIFKLGIVLTALTPAIANSHEKACVEDILTLKKSLETSNSKPVLTVAFWDFDGTILKGDCSEGMKQQGNVVFDGMAKKSIEAGFSTIYKKDQFSKLWQDYQYMDSNCGHWLAYPYLAQMLKGADEKQLRALAKKQFTEVYQKHYFQSSVNILNSLEKAGVQNYIISASADVFVDGAAKTLNLNKDRCHGIEQVSEDGKLTDQLVYPVTYAAGKTKKLKQIIAKLEKQYPDKKIVAVAAFGNSYSTDGDFMLEVAKQKFTGELSAPVIMINGGKAPAKYQGKFLEVEQTQTVSDSK